MFDRLHLQGRYVYLTLVHNYVVSSLLLTVVDSWRVPGLGTIVRGTAAGELRSFDLHTALPVLVEFADGRQQAVAATVEEMEHDGSTWRGLLLEFLNPTPLPPGTRILSTESIPLSDNSRAYSELI